MPFPRSRAYRLFWLGSFVSNCGLWMQQVALGWLVYGLTDSAAWLGRVSFASHVPTLVLGLFGGILVDRASRHAIMVGTQLALAATTGVLAYLAATDQATIGAIITLAMLNGAASALYNPAVHATVPSLVESDELLSAISLNAVQFNLARVVGPMVAGFAYASIGAGGCFALNAAGFLVMVVVLGRVRLPRTRATGSPPVLRALMDGLRYARQHPVIGPSLLITSALSTCGFPYIVMLPAIARDTLGLDASGLAFLTSTLGAGAVCGAFGLSLTGDPPRKALVGACAALAFGCALTSIAFVRTSTQAGMLLFVMGALQSLTITSLNTTIQTVVDDRLRGRVMSMMTVILFGFLTIGCLVLGALGDRIGVPSALACGGVVIVGCVGALLARAPALRLPVVGPAAR